MKANRWYVTLMLFVSCMFMASGQTNSPCDSSMLYVTIVRVTNSTPLSKIRMDTLVKDTLVRRSEIDLYFTQRVCQFPYYMPSCGIIKNECQLNECNPANYPGEVRCYSYDEMNRVTTMRIDGSGVMERYMFTYDSTGKLRQIVMHFHTLVIRYDRCGTISDIGVDELDHLEHYYILYRSK